MSEEIKYPKFADPAAEIIWLQGQLVQVQHRLAFQTERLRLRADTWEAHAELSSLHAQESQRLRAQVNELETDNAKLRAGMATEAAVCLCRCYECARGNHCHSMACGVPVVTGPAHSAPTAQVPAAMYPEPNATHNIAPAIALIPNPNAEVVQPYPNGRWP